MLAAAPRRRAEGIVIQAEDRELAVEEQTRDAREAPNDDRAAAEIEVLRELLAIAAHDLSNPLQSLNVLLELALDEIEEGSPTESKLENSLGAAEQLRSLIRGLAEFARGEPRAVAKRTVKNSLDACLGVCMRRFERQRIEMVRETSAIDGLGPTVPELRVAIMTTLFGCIHAAGHSGQGTHHLIVGADTGGAAPALTFEFLSADAQGQRQPLALDPGYLARLDACARGVSLDAVATGPGRIRLVLHGLTAG